jgi:hypothetical protein
MRCIPRRPNKNAPKACPFALRCNSNTEKLATRIFSISCAKSTTTPTGFYKTNIIIWLDIFHGVLKTNLSEKSSGLKSST